MPENRLRKDVKKIYAYLNDIASKIINKYLFVKVIPRSKTISYRFCLSNNFNQLKSKNYQIFLDKRELHQLLNIEYNQAEKILYDKIVKLYNRDKEELYAS